MWPKYKLVEKQTEGKPACETWALRYRNLRGSWRQGQDLQKLLRKMKGRIHNVEGIVASLLDFSGIKRVMENTLVLGTKDPGLSHALSPRDPETLGKLNTLSLRGNSWVKWFLRSLWSVMWYLKLRRTVQWLSLVLQSHLLINGNVYISLSLFVYTNELPRGSTKLKWIHSKTNYFLTLFFHLALLLILPNLLNLLFFILYFSL